MNFREYIELLNTGGMCKTADISSLSSQEFDLPSILYYFEKAHSGALYVKNIPGVLPNIVSNVYGDISRLALGIGVEPLQDEIDTIGKTAEGSSGGTGGFGNNRAHLLTARERTGFVLVKRKLFKSMQVYQDVNVIHNAPCMENVILESQADLTKICIPIQYNSGDGGAYINSGILITRSPKTGIINYAVRRHQVRNGKELGVFINPTSDTMKHLRQAAKCGEKLEAAIVIGVSPPVMLAACMSVPEPIGETSVAGNLLGHPLDVVNGMTVKLQVPACSEIVLEGFIDPSELKDEGPMTEYSDCSSGVSKRNVFHLTGIMHRSGPIYHALRSGRSREHELLQTVSQWSRTYKLKNKLNEIFSNVVCEIAFAAGSVASHVIIQVKRISKNTGNAILEWVLNNYGSKIATIIDETVCPFNQEEVAWATFVFAGSPDDFIKIDAAPTTPIDPASIFIPSKGRSQVCKIGINAISTCEFIKPVPTGWDVEKEARMARVFK